MLVCSGSASRLLEDVAAVEKLALIFEDPEVDAIAFIDPPTTPRPLPLGIAPEPDAWTVPHALAWRTDGATGSPSSRARPPATSSACLARALVARGAHLHWRYLRGPDAAPRTPSAAPGLTVRRPQPQPDPLPAALPALHAGAVARWNGEWRPSETNVLYRHRRVGSEERHLSVHAQPPGGFELDHVLGAARLFSPPGTTKLYATAVGQLPDGRAPRRTCGDRTGTTGSSAASS